MEEMKISKTTLDDKIKAMWRRYLSGDVVEFLIQNTTAFPKGFMNGFVDYLLESIQKMMNPENLVDLAQRLLQRYANKVSTETKRPEDFIDSFNPFTRESVNEDNEPRRISNEPERRRNAEANQRARDERNRRQGEALVAKAKAYLKNTGIGRRPPPPS